MTSPLLPAAAASAVLCLVSAVARADLAAHYPLDEAVDDEGPAVDAAGGNPGALINPFAVFRGEESARPVLGTAYVFDTTGGLDLGTAPAVRPADRFTITFWIRPDTLNDFDRFYESLAGTGNDGNGMRIDLGGAPGDSVRVLLRDGNGATNTQVTHSLDLFNDGTWFFVAVRYDSTVGDGTGLKLTVLEETGIDATADDIAFATESPGSLGTGPINVHAAGAWIAADDPAANGTNDYGGGLDDLAFFDDSDGNGVLTDAALAQVFNLGAATARVVESFTADPAVAAPGAAVTLSWKVGDFDTLVIDGIGDVSGATNAAGEGSVEVMPDESGTWILRAGRGALEDTASVAVIVGETPTISRFQVEGRSIVEIGTPVTLGWEVLGAASLTLNPGGVDVTGQVEVEVTPTATTTYELVATNAFGSISEEVTVTAFAFPPPAHRFDAASADNSDGQWIDEIGGNHWNLTDAARMTGLASAGTSLTAAYRLVGDEFSVARGGAAGGFPVGDRSTEVWIRPGELDERWQVVFENGGGQNGASILISDAAIRFLGSAGDVRTIDLEIPVAGLNLDDFLQIVYAIDDDGDVFEASVRDTFGNVRTAGGMGNVSRGGNGAGLFTWASGALGATTINLGGRTEAPDALPADFDLFVFTGEIALVNIYAATLRDDQIAEAFAAVATVVAPPADAFRITRVEFDGVTDQITLTWTSAPGVVYAIDYATNLLDWVEWTDATGAEGAAATTETIAVPGDAGAAYIRVRRPDAAP